MADHDIFGTKTLTGIIDSLAEDDPDAIIELWKDGQGNYTNARSLQQLVDEGNSIAASLLNDLQPGNIAAVLMNENEFWSVIGEGVNRAGACLAALYPFTQKGNLEYELNLSESKVVFVDDVRQGSRLSNLEKIVDLSDRLPYLKTVIVKGEMPSGLPGNFNFVPLDEYMQGPGNGRPNGITIAPDMTARLLFTSGSTGLPKGVPHTHGELSANIETIMRTFSYLGQDDRMMRFLPEAHILGTVVYKTFQVLKAKQYHTDRKSIADDMPKARPTFFLGVPKIWSYLADESFRQIYARLGFALRPLERMPSVYNKAISVLGAVARKRAGLDKVHTYASGSAPIGEHLQSKVDILFRPRPLKNGYGLTEAGVVSVITHEDHSGVGPALPGIDVEIVSFECDSENGEVWNAGYSLCRPGESGDIIVSGPSVMKGYFRNPEATKRAFTYDGKYITGDIGYIRDGSLVIVGRRGKPKFSDGEFHDPDQMSESFLRACRVRYDLGESPLISQVTVTELVSKDGQYATAAVVALDCNDKVLARYAQHYGVRVEDLFFHPQLVEDVRQEGVAAIKVMREMKIPLAEKVDKVLYVRPAFPGEPGLTETLKPQYSAVVKRYRNQLQELADDSKIFKLCLD